mgnify:CR=1 FL=1
MYTPIESSQVLQTSQVLVPSVSYVLVPETQYSYVAATPQVLPVVSLPTEVSQIVTPVPQVSQIAVSQVVPTVSVAPPMPQLPPQPVPVPPPMPKPLAPSPPYEAFVPPTPVTKSVSDNAPPQIYQFYKAVPAPAPAPAPLTASLVNVPLTTSVNIPVTTSVNIPVTTSYSTYTAPVPVVPTTNLLLEVPQYQTTTASSFI